MKELLKVRTWRVIITIVVGGIVAVVPFAQVSASRHSTTTLTTKGASGLGANNDIHKSQARTLSANGRVSVFSSQATNLTSGPHNAMEQVYAYDRITKQIELVSRNAAGEPGSGGSYVPTISADGRYVAYATEARDVAPGLNDFCDDWPDPCTNIIVHDLITKYTKVVNRNANGDRLPSIHTGIGGDAPIITRDGRFVTFMSNHPFNSTNWEGFRLVVKNLEDQRVHVVNLYDHHTGQFSESGAWDATINDTGRFIAFSSGGKLVENDFNSESDIYLYDIWDDRITFVSKGMSGFGGNGRSSEPVISTDGNFVVYESAAENLTSNDHNKKTDVFLYDRRKGTNTRISTSTKGVPGSDNSFAADISGDGQYVVYASYAPNLVAVDTTDIDAFLYYTNFGATRLISRASYNGVPGNGHSIAPSVSQDGKAIAFLSKARNLTEDNIAQHTLFNNMFISFDIFRHIPYYDDEDLFELF